jgi:NHLM bacteriocin system ABC transporter ATP-binding protein
MAHSIASLEQAGTILQPSGSNPFDLGQRDAVWVVLEGKIDIFVCAQSLDGKLGARYHFLRVEPGNAAFGIEFQQPGITYLASSAPGTRLLLLKPEVLSERIADKDEGARSLIEGWIEAVSARFCTKRFPLSFVDACADSLIRIPEETQAIVATDGVIWVRHRSGESWPLDDHRLPKVNGSGYFPVSRFAWLQASSASELDAVSTFSLPEFDQSWQSLHDFHAFIECLLNIERAEALQEEQNRIRQRASLDITLLDNALWRLTAPIRKMRSWSDGGKSCTNPVFLALQMVAAEMDIKLTPPFQMLQNLEIPDPVGMIAKTSSVRVRKVALKGSWWKGCSGPLLCFTEEDHRPVALLLKSSKAEIYDPSARMFTPLNEKLALELNPIAYTLYRPFPSKALNGFDLLRFGLTRSTRELLLIAGTGIATGALAIVNPYVTGIIFDRLIPGAERSQLYQTAALLFVVAIASSMFMFVRGFATLRLQGKMDAAIQAAVWDRLLGLPVSFFRDYSSGDLAQRSMGISQMRDILTGSALNAVLSGIFSVFSFALLFYYSVRLAVIGTILVAVACVVSMAGGLTQLSNRRRILDVSGRLSSKLLQFVGGIAKFRVSGTEGRAFSVWAREFSAQKQISVNARQISNLLSVFNSVFPVVSLAVIFYANAHFFMVGQGSALSTGEFLAFLAAFTQFLLAALTLSNTFLGVVSVIPIYERTKPILHAVPESSDAKSSPGTLSGEIEISHVSFSYREDSPLVLRDMSLRIGAGQAVAFVGSSGCGKSTLLRILLGFERPTSGMVYYDGQDLAGLDIQAVRRQIGVVLQTSKPVSGSIFENIVGSAPLSIEDAWEACRLAGLDEDIKRMPMGLHTNISDGGGGISGGQRQRLMIARAIVGKPRILLFDEATSALDNRTQAIVSHSLAGLQATRIVIAHRLSTVVKMDKIFVLDKGCVAESGTYEELMQRGEMFHELAKRQLT